MRVAAMLRESVMRVESNADVLPFARLLPAMPDQLPLFEELLVTYSGRWTALPGDLRSITGFVQKAPDTLWMLAERVRQKRLDQTAFVLAMRQFIKTNLGAAQCRDLEQMLAKRHLLKVEPGQRVSLNAGPNYAVESLGMVKEFNGRLRCGANAGVAPAGAGRVLRALGVGPCVDGSASRVVCPSHAVSDVS